MSLLILVVDDEPDVEPLFRQQFRRDIRAGRFTMEFAQSAADALEQIERAEGVTLILVLSDINMPGMSGLELLPKIKELRPDVPVIMITAYGDAETKRKALENGAEALLTKPIDFAALRRRDRNAAGNGGVTARILVVDDEPDLEALDRPEIPAPDPRRRGHFPVCPRRGGRPVRHRRQQRHRHGAVRHQHAAHGRPVAAGEAAAGRGAAAFDRHRLRLWRHGQHPHGDEPRRLRLHH